MKTNYEREFKKVMSTTVDIIIEEGGSCNSVSCYACPFSMVRERNSTSCFDRGVKSGSDPDVLLVSCEKWKKENGCG